MQIKAFPSKRPRIEMVPLIDMFFLLLVFFIFGVFSMTMQEGLIVDLPAAETAVTTTEESLTITVTAEGSLFLNQEPIALNDLSGSLRQHRLRAADPLVTINADRRTAHGTVMAVLDAVRQAGLARVSFQTEGDRS
ncbi:MAG: biopolymer transporter ExbD [Candidatus Omnitrophica bacterium]|nr:biopolymer transporter ExbD [Candidatus Omnitrophota bacterium]